LAGELPNRRADREKVERLLREEKSLRATVADEAAAVQNEWLSLGVDGDSEASACALLVRGAALSMYRRSQ
jgi:hypothetical protein